MKRGLIVAGFLVFAASLIWLFRPRARPLPAKPRTVEGVLSAIGPAIDARLRPAFTQAGVAYPPPKLTLVALKAEKRLELYAPDAGGTFRLVQSYPILAASGEAGPKLREGDCQVPEGFYRIELLNPNSRYHLSLRVNYPNPDDLARARAEQRDLSTLGGDIMIHGGAASIGCLAVGNPAAEDLFVLAARTGLDHIELLITPWDFRNNPLPPDAAGDPDQTLYRRLADTLRVF